MSVIVEQLSKVYDTQRALDQVSFSIRPGQITGLLGPNGAGKSTTMKIISCFIPQTSGKASVCGFDVAESPLEVRKNIGYLPEHNPLYLDMYVKEYLAFVAGIHKLPNISSTVANIIERTGLTPEYKKKIGQLSKGYRQRVGLASAMIHNPQVLILDEPTSGLDPNQVQDMRALIRELGKEKTVLLSTHIMQEVEALCNKVIIISKGRIVADDDTENLRKTMQGGVIITVKIKEEVDAASFKNIPGVSSVKKLSDNSWQLNCSETSNMNERIFAYAVQNGMTILELKQEQSSLEEVFQKLTKS